MTKDNDLILYGAIALAALYVLWKPREVGAAIVNAAGDVIVGGVNAAGELVVSGGEAIGIPRTNDELCSIAIAAGDSWAASKYCPAGRFLETTPWGMVFK